MTRLRRALIGTAIARGMSVLAAPTASAADNRHITLEMSECGVMYLATTGTCIVSL